MLVRQNDLRAIERSNAVNAYPSEQIVDSAVEMIHTASLPQRSDTISEQTHSEGVIRHLPIYMLCTGHE